MAIVRKKVVDIDGAEITIGSLTMDQVEEFIKWSPEGKTLEQMKERAYALIIMALTNASFETATAPWTEARINKEFDLTVFDRLQHEILDWSKLKVVIKAGTIEPQISGPAGEAPAVP